jgi:hypothetical protein
MFTGMGSTRSKGLQVVWKKGEVEDWELQTEGVKGGSSKRWIRTVAVPGNGERSELRKIQG